MRAVNTEEIANAFMGLYSEGKELAYEPTGFRQKKIDQLRKVSSRVAFKREAITIDTHEDKLMLEQIKNTALQKVKTITNKSMLQSILQGLSEEGASNKNPLQLADEIIRNEADRKRLQTDYADKDSRELLKSQLSNLYENQLWKVQRIMRTEAVNGFVVAQLQGYREQGIVKVMWNSHHDERTCPKCRALDGKTFEIDDMLANGNRYPISMKSHPNCRCVGEHTRVRTRDGWKAAIEVQVGEEVLTGTSGWQRVTHKFVQTKSQSDRKDVRMYSLNGVRVTGDHQVKVIDENGVELWKRVDALDKFKDRLVKPPRMVTREGCQKRSIATKRSLSNMRRDDPDRYAENCKRRGEGIKKAYTPELRVLRAEAARRQFEDPTHVQLHREKAKRQWQTDPPISREANSASMHKRWAENRDEMLGYMADVEKKKFNELERRVQNALDRYHVPWVAQQIVAGQLCDLLLPGNVVIEVDGAHWHGGCELCGKQFVRLQDVRKEETLKDAGFKLYRICECQMGVLDTALAGLLEAAYAQR
jgi:SPP1 gp7 family putative phage head morphogenesis protein